MKSDLTRHVILSYSAFQASADIKSLAPDLELSPVEGAFAIRVLRQLEVGGVMELHDLIVALAEPDRDKLYDALRAVKEPPIEAFSLADLDRARRELARTNGHQH